MPTPRNSTRTAADPSTAGPFRLRARTTLALALVVGIATRVVLAASTRGNRFDLSTFGSWGQTLHALPLGRFYAAAFAPDHLPGDLYLHDLLAWAYTAGGGQDFHGASYRLLLKLVPCVADVLIGLLLLLVVARLVGVRAGAFAALAYLLNPATVFLSAVWGQWDAVSGLALLAGCALLWLYPRLWWAAVPLLTWAVLVKPPLAVMVVLAWTPMVLQELRSAAWPAAVRRLAARGLGALALATGTAFVVLRPFDVGLLGVGAHWSLAERLTIALDRHPFTTLGAANFWALVDGPNPVPDQRHVLAGLAAHTVGLGLFIAVVLLLVVQVVRFARTSHPLRLTVWSMACANWAYYLLLTRVHERYLFPTVLMLVLLAGLTYFDPRVLSITAYTSLVFFTILLNDYEGFAFAHNTGVQLLLAVADLVLFGITLTMPHWRGSPLAETRADERLRAVRTTGAPGAASAPGGAARQAG